LTAEGVTEVVNALRRIQSESGKSAGGATRSFLGLNSALAGAKGLILQLGAAVGVGALIALTRQASEAADKLGKMGQSVGASVENLSALRLVSEKANVPMEALTATLTIFNKQVGLFQSGSKDVVAAFEQIGVSVEDLRGLDAAERLDLLASKFGALKDSPEKAALALQIFGRRAAEIIPLLNDLSEGGLPAAAREAERLGVVLTEETARAAQAVNDDFTTLKLQLETGFARFVQGLAPQIASTMQSIQTVLGKNADAWQFWGEVVGGIVKGVGFFLVSTFDAVATTIRQIGVIAGGVFSAIDKGIRRDFAGAADDVRAIFAILKKEETGFEERQRSRNEAFNAAPKLAELRAGVQDTEAGEREKVVDEDKLRRERERLRLEQERLQAARERLIFQRATEVGDAAVNALASERARIEEEVALGLTSRAEGEVAVTEAQRQALPLLREILASYVLIAVANPFDEEAAIRAQEFAAVVAGVGRELQAVDDTMKQVETTAKNALEGALVNALTDAIAEGTKFLDVLRNIALAVVQAVQQLLAFEVAKRIVAAIPGFSGGGQVRGLAGGGMVSGPGTGTSDSIPARLSAGEFVVPAAVVARPGVLGHLEALRGGTDVPGLRAYGGARRYAEGGLVAAGAGSVGATSLTVALAPGLVVQELSTPEGERAVVRVLSKMPKAAARALGG